MILSLLTKYRCPVCKWRHEAGERQEIKKGCGAVVVGGEVGGGMIIQVKAASRVERAQSVPELKGKIMG